MADQLATLGERSRVGRAALVASSLLVLAVAVAFDLAADEPPTHALTVGLVAGVVGLGRIWLNGRHRGLFVLVNLAVLGQRVLHAIGKLAHAGADLVAPGHEWPQPLTGVVVHGAVALFLVAVAASEPIVFAVAVTAMRALLRFAWTLPSPSPASPSRPRHDLGSRAKGRRRLDATRARRRGPPGRDPSRRLIRSRPTCLLFGGGLGRGGAW